MESIINGSHLVHGYHDNQIPYHHNLDNVSMTTTGMVVTSGSSIREESADCTTFNFIYDFIIIGTLCLLGFLGNTISIIVLQKDHFNKVTLFLFQALAVADNTVLVMSFMMLSVIFGLLPYANAHMMSKSAAPFLIKYFHPFAYISHCCTIWITVLLAIYRYVAICQPFKATNWCTMSRARLQVAMVVFGSTLFNLPRFFQFDIVTKTIKETDSNETVNIYQLKETTIGEHTIFGKIYTNLLYTVIAVIIPLTILVILNLNLIKEIKNAKKRTKALGHPKMEDDNITLIMVVIIVVVLVCHTPDRILEIVKYFNAGMFGCGYVLFYFLNVCNLLIIINSSTNFIVYYLLRRGFRQILMRRLCSMVGVPEDEKTEAEHLPLGVTSHSVPDVQNVIRVNGSLKSYGIQNGRQYSI